MAFSRIAAPLSRVSRAVAPRVASQRGLCTASASTPKVAITRTPQRSKRIGSIWRPGPLASVRLVSTSPSFSSSPSSSSSSEPEGDSAADIARYDFSSITRLSDQLSSPTPDPSPARILIDVREPSELINSGRIPGACNMPINSAPDGLFLPPDEFEDRFGFTKPDVNEQEVVFYCKAGVRSRAAARVARMAGFQKVGEYPGSWVDWEEKGGEVER